MVQIAAFLMAIHVLLTQNGAPAATVRGSTALPVPAQSLAQALGQETAEPSTLLLRVIRRLYGEADSRFRRSNEELLKALAATPKPSADLVPLPLSPELWRSALLPTAASDQDLISAIVRDRSSALLYVGLCALDDETLSWLGTNRGLLLYLPRHADVFAAFGRSLHVRDGRIVVPGGAEAEAAWQSVTGADPAEPDVFIARVIDGNGRLAFLYDTIAHLDAPHQRFALGLRLSAALQAARLRTLLDIFTVSEPEWRINERPFSRPPLDGAILLSTIRVSPDGALVQPAGRRLWERVFRGDQLNDVPFEQVSDADVQPESASLMVDAPWLTDRILRVPYAIGRRRLDALLFAQRVFASQPEAESSRVATALRGYLSFPALMISLERTGFTDPEIYVHAAQHANRLNGIESPPMRRVAIAQFQSALALMERVHRTGGLDLARTSTLVTSLCSLDVSNRTGYSSGFAAWLRDGFLASLSKRESSEDAVLAAIAGVPEASASLATIEWEGRRYRVDPASAELNRLQRVRERQGGLTLDAALSAFNNLPERDRRQRQAADAGQALADTLTSIVYAIHLGDPDGAAVTSGNVALRHDFGLPAQPSRGPSDAWGFPMERFDGRAAWRVRGSLLGLETALARLVLRRVDLTTMPEEPKVGSQDRQTVMLTAALIDRFALSDQSRDTVATSIARGRTRALALTENPSKLNEVADAAGLSEWRREALSWGLSHKSDPLSAFSLLELFWLGAQGSDTGLALDAWGAATLPLTGCLCLAMPPPSPWEDLAGYASPVLATHGADVPLKIAETLYAQKLPAGLAPALAGFVTQDVIDHAQLAYPDDWEEFGRAVKDLPRERMFDYIAALTASGPLIEDGAVK